jgi:hypothetical protein
VGTQSRKDTTDIAEVPARHPGTKDVEVLRCGSMLVSNLLRGCKLPECVENNLKCEICESTHSEPFDPKHSLLFNLLTSSQPP